MNTFIKRRTPGGLLLSAIILLVMLCATAETVQAQSVQPLPAAINWKSQEDATNILIAQVGVLNQQMPGLSVGTPLYDNTLRRLAYFKAILVDIGKGTPLAQALENALPAAATLGFEKEASYTPKILLKALHTETRILLTN